jgi:hypothetical protein
MATTEHFYTGNGSTTTYAYTFPILQNSDLKVELDNVLKTENTSGTNNDYSISGTNVVFNSAPGSSVDIHIYRLTDVDSPKAVFAAGSSIRAGDLNNIVDQALYSAQEQNQQIRTSDFKDSSITSAKILDGTIVNVDVSSTAAIDGTKIAPDFGSQNITTTGNISTSGTINNLTTTEVAILDGATVSTAELNKLDGVTASTSELNILDGVTATATEINTLDGITATTAELNQAAGITSGIQSQIDGKQPLDSELTELATMGSGTASSLADLSSAEVQTLDGITASTTELNLLDGKSIVTSIGNSATDTQLPSAQAVNERIVELVTEVGGFAPIANETSFPTTNPDINDGAGTIVSIKALASNLTSNGSGVATIANGAGSGNTVTINGLANNDTIEAGKGILVETTTTLHTYTFHREVIDPAGVTNAASLVSDFNDRYQISGNPPSNHPDGSALQDGDLWFDTSANVMKVYNLSNTQYDAVTSVGDFKLLTVVPDGATSGSPTFNGSIVSYDLRDGTNAAAVTSVGQLLVSLNGVIQKPNSGSYNASNEGFYLEGTNGIKFCTAPPSGSTLFVTLIGSATSIGTPNDNTVSEAKLTSDSVSEAKLKVSNSPVNGYFLSAQSGNTGGLTWAQVNTELVGDTSPQLGGDLDVQSSKVTTSTTNGNVKIEPNGTGVVEVRGAGGNDGTLQLNCSAQSHGVKIKSPPHSAGASYTLTLPNNIVNGQFLKTDASGNLSWAAVDLTALSASNLTSGTIPDARFPATLPAASAANLTSIPAANITGTLPALDGSNLTGLASTVADGCVYENSQTISNNYTVGTNKNAFSAGPITIASGATVTVPSGSTYTIV